MTITLFDTEMQAEFPSLDGIVYLSGVSTQHTRDAQRSDLGYLVTPESDPSALQCEYYEFTGADNGCFNSSKPGRTFDADKWLRWLERVPVANSLFAVLPDVLDWLTDPDTGQMFPVGDFERTIERSAKYVDAVKSLGFPAAIVLQDGAKSLDEIPFAVDAVFVGGSDDFKLGPDAARIVGQARDRGMWSHMGRVNSLKRLRYAHEIGCDSADGTFLKFCRKADQASQFGRMVKWLDTVNAQGVIR